MVKAGSARVAFVGGRTHTVIRTVAAVMYPGNVRSSTGVVANLDVRTCAVLLDLVAIQAVDALIGCGAEAITACRIALLHAITGHPAMQVVLGDLTANMVPKVVGTSCAG